MAKVVNQQVLQCRKCKRPTLHYQNTKQMSWLMHLVLAIFTGGLWLIVWVFLLLWHGLTKPVNAKWTCSACGGKG